METFEIHITGSDEKIIDQLNTLGIKSIQVALLSPEGYIFRTEYMSSTVQKFKNVDECIKWVDGLTLMLEARGIKIVRKKIECPYYEHYLGRTLYMESHWKIENLNCKFPISENLKSGKLMATDRTYNKDIFNWFLCEYNVEDKEVEMCLLDTYISEDFDWFNFYGK